MIQRCYKYGKYGILSCYKHIDWKLYFGKKEDDECSERGCSHLNRMINALKYYSKVQVMSNESDKQQFLEFVQETYVSLLSDYVHIMARHCEPAHVDEVQAAKSKEFVLINKCDATNCLLLFFSPSDPNKHRFRASKYLLDGDGDVDDSILFYRDLMDSMHCHLVHSIDIGIRIKTTRKKEENERLKTWKDPKFDYVSRLKCRKHKVYVFATKNCHSRGP